MRNKRKVLNCCQEFRRKRKRKKFLLCFLEIIAVTEILFSVYIYSIE